MDKKYRNASYLGGLINDETGLTATLNIVIPQATIVQIGVAAFAVVVLGQIVGVVIKKLL